MTTLMRRNGNPAKSLRLFSPFDEFENVVNRIFDSYYSGNEQNLLNIPLELKEKGNQYILQAQIAGMRKEDINVEVGEDYVNISGEYKREEDGEDTMVYRSEFCVGSFNRTVGLPAKINHQKAKADYKDGVLTLMLPKSEEERQKITKLSL